MLTTAIALAGMVAYLQLPVAPLPQVDFPTITVSALAAGRQSRKSWRRRRRAAGTPIRPHRRRHRNDLRQLLSASTRITLQFDLNRNIDGAARDVQAAINAARANLPANLPSNPTYRKVNPADAPIMILALTSDIYEPGPAVRRGVHDHPATVAADSRRRPGHRRRRLAARPCAWRSIPRN